MKTLIVYSIAAWVILFGGNTFAADKKSDAESIKIDNFTFTPKTFTVKPGAKVTWINRDDVPHKVVSADKKLFSSPPLDTDEQFSYTFAQPGTYDYFCAIHPRMTGKIIVK